MVYDGHFDVPLASALGHTERVSELLRKKDTEAALSEARKAAEIYPDSVRVQTALGEALLASQQPVEARAAFEKALQLAKTIEPEIQAGSAAELEQRLSAKQ
jgi:Flp pilus assembly protein TadD